MRSFASYGIVMSHSMSERGHPMVSNPALISMIFTLVVSLVLPIVILLALMKGRKGVFSVWVAGALGFVVPQLIIRIPILQYLGQTAGFQAFALTRPILYAFLLALTAGIFETVGRLVVLKYTLAGRLSFRTGLAAGAGHGGIEAMVLIGLTYVNNLVVSFMINTGKLSQLIPDNPAMADSIRKLLVETPPATYLMAGLERMLTMVFHTALSVLLAWFIYRKHGVLGFILVTTLHFAVDFTAVILSQNGISMWVIEGALLVIAGASLFMIRWLKPRFQQEQEIPVDPGEQAVNEGF